MHKQLWEIRRMSTSTAVMSASDHIQIQFNVVIAYW